MVIGITKKLDDKLKIGINSVPDILPNAIYCWHAHLFIWNRRNCVLFMNNKTRYCILLYGIKQGDKKNLQDLFLTQLSINMQNDGITIDRIDRYIEGCGDIYMTKTTDRSIIGSINDAILLLGYTIADYYNNGFFDQNGVNSEINDYVMGPLAKSGFPPFPNRAMKIELERM